MADFYANKNMKIIAISLFLKNHVNMHEPKDILDFHSMSNMYSTTTT